MNRYINEFQLKVHPAAQDQFFFYNGRKYSRILFCKVSDSGHVVTIVPHLAYACYNTVFILLEHPIVRSPRDDVVNRYINEFQLKVHPAAQDQIFEIDTPDELAAVCEKLDGLIMFPSPEFCIYTTGTFPVAR